MKPHTDSFDSSISDELRQVRTDALDHTASAIRSIRRQKELTIEECMQVIQESGEKTSKPAKGRHARHGQ